MLVFRKRKESFGVERKKSGAAAPTKRIEQNRIFKFELTKQSSGTIPSTSAVGEVIGAPELFIQTHNKQDFATFKINTH